MAIRTIVTHPDPRLRVKTRKVTSFDSHLQTLINDMFDTLYACGNGVGLASTQIGEDLCLAVIDVSPDRTQPLVLVNPEIISSRNPVRFNEGCLSVPGVDETVERANWVKFKAQDHMGTWYEKEAEDLLAECVQHEIDHLNGKLYIDCLSKLKLDRLLKKYQKQ